MAAKFQISEVISTSWKAVKSQIWVLAGLFIGYTIISFIISTFIMPSDPYGANLFSMRTGIGYLISLIIGSLFMLGYIKNLFQTLDGEEPQFSAYGQQASKLLTYLGAYILYLIVMLVGLILFIIPGIYLAIRLQFFMAFIVQENAGVMESLKKSWEITKGQTGHLFLLGLVMLGIIIVGFIVFIIGVFVAAPVTYMMYCVVFRKLYPNPLKLSDEIVE